VSDAISLNLNILVRSATQVRILLVLSSVSASLCAARLAGCHNEILNGQQHVHTNWDACGEQAVAASSSALGLSPHSNEKLVLL
jgi:hypothetical protein